MPEIDPLARYLATLRRRPDAWARLRGSGEFPRLHGAAQFFQTEHGVLIAVDVTGLPLSHSPCGSEIFAFHIHDGSRCTGNTEDPFANAGTHYDPDKCPHPAHAGDLPPLFSNRGHAFQVVLTDRFTLREVLGRAIIIHSAPDDFTTQPAGNAGVKIACGIIRPSVR